MRTLKENFFGNLGIGKAGKRQLIEDWLDKYKRNITRPIINDDLTINAKSVNFSGYSENNFPDFIQFNLVDKDFDISFSNLTSLEGAPEKCNEFYCNRCKNLTSLEGGPKWCKIFGCYSCTNLTSLKGAPKKCVEFNCSGCDNLTSLEGAPKECESFNCKYCENLTSLKGAPEKCKTFNCTDCGFTEEDIKKVCNAKYRYW